jgi:hypothetical protein
LEQSIVKRPPDLVVDAAHGLAEPAMSHNLGKPLDPFVIGFELNAWRIGDNYGLGCHVTTNAPFSPFSIGCAALPQPRSSRAFAALTRAA